MQAVRVHDGGTLVFETVPDPVPAAGEALVELRCAGLNRRDSYVARGTYPFPLPLIPGSDGSGVRRDTGEEVVVYPGFGWPAGAAFPPAPIGILGGPRDGTLAELIALPVENLYPRPTRFSWEESAAFPLAALTAYRALFTRARLQPNETVLVLGAGSGVSTFAVQLAAQAFARVFVTSSSDERIEHAKALGAEWGVNYAATEDWPAAVKEHGGVDVVIDAVGSTWQQSLDCVRLGGRVVVFGATGGTEAALQVRPFYFNQLSLLGTGLGGPDDMSGLLRMVADGSWRPVLDSVQPLADAAAAIERMVSGDAVRKARADVQLNVRAWGDPASPPVVCIHGLAGFGGRFARIAAEYLPSKRVLAVDLRGHGHSGWEPPWDLGTHVADLLETADRARGRPGRVGGAQHRRAARRRARSGRTGARGAGRSARSRDADRP